MRIVLGLAAIFVWSSAAGCQHAPERTLRTVNIPEAEDVLDIEIKSAGTPFKRDYHVTLTDRADIDMVIDWLKRIDWSPSKAQEASTARLSNVGSITISMRDAHIHAFGLAEGAIIFGRWEWQADTRAIMELVKHGGR
jgi:hypothetical protein